MTRYFHIAFVKGKNVFAAGLMENETNFNLDGLKFYCHQSLFVLLVFGHSELLLGF